MEKLTAKRNNEHLLDLSAGQINNLRGVIAEKIIAMNLGKIRDIIMSEIGNEWQEIFFSPCTEDWLSLFSGPRMLYMHSRRYECTSSNPEIHMKNMQELIETGSCYLFSEKMLLKKKEAENIAKNNSTLFPLEGVTIADFSFVVYKLKKCKEKVQRSFIVHSEDNPKKVIKREIISYISVIEDIKPVLVEVKNFKHRVKLTDAQQKALYNSRTKKEFFYYIFNLSFEYAVDKNIKVRMVQDNIYKDLK